MLSTIFFDVVPQNAESKVVPEYEVGHGGFLQMFKGRRLNIYHCAYFRNIRHAVSFLEWLANLYFFDNFYSIVWQVSQSYQLLYLSWLVLKMVKDWDTTQTNICKTLEKNVIHFHFLHRFLVRFEFPAVLLQIVTYYMWLCEGICNNRRIFTSSFSWDKLLQAFVLSFKKVTGAKS